MNKDSLIYVSGHRGLLGSSIVRQLKNEGYETIVTKPKELLDLRNQLEVNAFFEYYRPEYVFLVASVVGGIKANNTRKAEFIYDNTMIQSNVIHASYLSGVKKLVFTGSNCIYPKISEQPIKEEYLLTGELEPTNEPYAIAKLNGIKMCQAYRSQYGCNFISAMPCNIYGVNDKYDLDNCHVLPALLRKIINAKEKNLPTVEIWGTGSAMREFIYVDDVADALIFLMQNYDSPEIINIGSRNELSIKDIAEFIKNMVQWNGEFVFNNELEGTVRKKLDTSKLSELGWVASTSLLKGLHLTIQDIYKTGKHLGW